MLHEFPERRDSLSSEDLFFLSKEYHDIERDFFRSNNLFFLEIARYRCQNLECDWTNFGQNFACFCWFGQILCGFGQANFYGQIRTYSKRFGQFRTCPNLRGDTG